MLKLFCKNTDGVQPDLLTIGKEYEIAEPFNGYYMVNDYAVSLSNFETPLEVLTRLASIAKKIILSKPCKSYTVELLITDNYIIVYSHSKGNNWNICGNHYRYFHDLRTGEFLGDYSTIKEKPHLKQRLLKADYIKLQNILVTKHS